MAGLSFVISRADAATGSAKVAVDGVDSKQHTADPDADRHHGDAAVVYLRVWRVAWCVLSTGC